MRSSARRSSAVSSHLPSPAIRLVIPIGLLQYTAHFAANVPAPIPEFVASPLSVRLGSRSATVHAVHRHRLPDLASILPSASAASRARSSDGHGPETPHDAPLHERAQNGKGSTGRATPIRAPGSDPLPDRIIVGYPDTRVPEAPDPSRARNPRSRRPLRDRGRGQNSVTALFSPAVCLSASHSRVVHEPIPREGPGEIFVRH